MDNDYFLVAWVRDPILRFSVKRRSEINDVEERTLSCEALLNKEVSFKFNKQHNDCIGKILDSGSKDEMEIQLGLKVKEHRSAPKPSKVQGAKQREVKLPNRLAVAKKSRIDTVLLESADNEKDLKIKHLTEALRISEEKLRISEEKRTDLEAECNTLRHQVTVGPQELSKTTNIGNGIHVETAVLATLKSVSSNTSVYARNLFKKLFAVDEIIGYSLMGKGCNANKQGVQPSVDPSRRDAIIEHTLTAYGKTPGTEYYNLAKVALKKSLSSLIVEITKEAKDLESQATKATGSPTSPAD